MKLTYTGIILIFLFACTSSENPHWKPIWNGKDLTGWHTYLGEPYEGIGEEGVIYNLDKDPLDVIRVVDQGDETMVRISGVSWGMMYTEESFGNYHLKLKVKWGEGMHKPRENGPRDSGLLYHGFGEPGSAYVWMHSQELQIQQGDMGDYWPVGSVEIDVPSKPIDSLYYQYDPNSDLRTYYSAEILETAFHDSLARRRVFKAFDAERPHGEWNDVELIAFGDSSVHVVNGEVVMRLYNSRKADKQPLKSGRIILQSEGAEVFYKDIMIKPISQIPEKYRE